MIAAIFKRLIIFDQDFQQTTRVKQLHVQYVSYIMNGIVI